MQKAFACLLNGYLEIQKDGYYIFELGDEGGSRIYLGNLKVIGEHYDTRGGSTYMVPLQKGFYPFRVEYFPLASQEGLNWRRKLGVSSRIESPNVGSGLRVCRLGYMVEQANFKW